MEKLEEWYSAAQNKSSSPNTKTKNFRIRALIDLIRKKDEAIKSVNERMKENFLSPFQCLIDALALTDSLGESKEDDEISR